MWKEIRHLLNPELLLKAQTILRNGGSVDESFLSAQLNNVRKRLSQLHVERHRLLDERFLATARIVRMKPVGVGITNPYKAYLTNGDRTIKAIWKSTTKPVLFSSGSKAPSPSSSAEKKQLLPKDGWRWGA